MDIQTRLVEYEDSGYVMEGLLAWDDRVKGPRPGVLVAHTIMGRSNFEESRARRLAECGYVGLAIDVYGKGTHSNDPKENRSRMVSLLDDRLLLQRRLLAAVQTLGSQAEVDSANIAAIGFCFGGLCVLDIARTGEDIAGVVSLHGLFSAPGNTTGNQVLAKVLVLHGWDDPMATPDQLIGLAEELTAMGADWQFHGYGNTMHAFTNPAANEREAGKVYCEQADRRSWHATQDFLSEAFAAS